MDKFYLAITKTSLDEGVNEHGAGLIPNEGAALNNGTAPGDEVEDPQDLMDHPDNFQGEAFGQLLVNVQELKDVVGE